MDELVRQGGELDDFSIEIIVSEDSSDRQSKKIVEKYEHARWLSGPCKGPGANRNHASNKALGGWLLFLDDDVFPQEELLKAHAHEIRQDNYDVLEGGILCEEVRNSPFYRMAENLKGGNLFTANLAVRRDTFEELGGFDEELIIMEDLEFAERLKRAGKRIRFVEKAMVSHPAQRIGAGYLWNWIFHFKWGILLGFKTGRNDPQEGYFTGLIQVTKNQLVLLSRKTVHLFTQHNQRSWANAWFWQVWGWLTLPLSLSNLWYWEIRYRQNFRKRSNAKRNTESEDGETQARKEESR